MGIINHIPVSNLKLNGLVQENYVYANEKIESGDFVEFKEEDYKWHELFLKQEATTAQMCLLEKMSENTLIAYQEGNIYFIEVGDGNFHILSQVVNSTLASGSVGNMAIVKVTENCFAILAVYNSGLNIFTYKIENNEMTLLHTKVLGFGSTTMTYSSYYLQSFAWLGEGYLGVTYGYQDFVVLRVLDDLSFSAIYHPNFITTTSYADTDNRLYIMKIGENKGILHFGQFNGSQTTYFIKCEGNSVTSTSLTFTTLTNASGSTSKIKSGYISHLSSCYIKEGECVVLFSNDSMGTEEYRMDRITFVEGSLTLTAEQIMEKGTIVVSSYSYSIGTGPGFTSVHKLDENKFLLWYVRKSGLYSLSIVEKGSNGLYTEIAEYDYNDYNDTFGYNYLSSFDIWVRSLNSSSNGSIWATSINAMRIINNNTAFDMVPVTCELSPEIQIIKTTQAKSDGVAKSGGSGGTRLEGHQDKIQIYVPDV